MHVTLLDDVKALGPKGATVDVPEGYALNFLFPQHLAVKVSAQTLTDAQEAKSLRSLKPQAVSGDQALAADLDGLEVVLEVPVTKGKLRQPVTAAQVRAALKDMGYTVSKALLKVPDITEPGNYDVPLNFPSGYEAKLSLVVDSVTA